MRSCLGDRRIHSSAVGGRVETGVALVGAGDRSERGLIVDPNTRSMMITDVS